jgi:hypothetical protein
MRGSLLAVWVGLGLGVIFFGLARPLFRRFDSAALAGLIETRYPELLERLTSTVELSGPVDVHHGSRQFIDFLVKETEKQSGHLDFGQAVPKDRTGRLAWGAIFAILALVIPAIVWPQRAKELAGRFLMPWRDPAASPIFTIEVAPGDTFVGRGQMLNIVATVQAEKENTELPRSGRVVVVQNGVNKSFRMEAEHSNQFALKMPRDLISKDFDYYVEAGYVTSSRFHVEVVEPVQMTADSPKVYIVPPAYAQGTIDSQTKPGLVDLAVLQHSELTFHCQFTRPAVAASLEWTADGGAKQVIPLQLADGKEEGNVALTARTGGSFRLVMEAEHGIRTELPLHRVDVKIDQPPVFDKVSGTNEIKMVRSYEPIPIEFSLLDDVGVDAAFVEFSINKGAPIVEPITLQGKGTLEAKGRHTLSLASIVQEGDEVTYRLKAIDNRRIPEIKLEPNVAYFPEKGFRTLKIARQADPLFQQEIEAQRDTINNKLDEIKQNLMKEERSVYKLKQESKDQPSLQPDQKKDLQEASRQNRAIEDALRDLSQETGETPGLERLADLALRVADKEMRQSAEALHDAEKEKQQEVRDSKLEKSDKQLNDALEKLDALKDANQKLAQQRLDQKKLEMAAERERHLAEKAADLAKKENADPSKSEEVKREQKELSDDVKQLAEKSEAIRKAMEAARAEETKQLADKARELAKAERDLDQAIREREKEQLKGRLDDLARKQEKLAEKADQLAQETKKSLDKPKADAFKPEEAKKATQSLKHNEPAEAMKHQDHATVDLDKLATNLDKAANDAKASKEVAKELANRQKETLNRTEENQAKKDPKAMPALEQEQRALEKAIKEMPVPNTNQEAKEQHQRASDKAESAANQLKNNDQAKARDQMEKARQALEKLAEKLPSKNNAESAKESGSNRPGEKEKQQGEQARRLAKEQRELREEVERATVEATKEDRQLADNPLGELGKQQQEIAQKAGELAKGVEKEQGAKSNPTEQAKQAAQAAKKASDKLQAGAPKQARDAGQQSAEKLRQLAQRLGETPANPDPQAPDTAQEARQLAKQQEDLNKRLEPFVADKAANQAQQQARQQDLKQQTGDLSQRLRELAEQMRESQQAQDNARKASGSAQKGQDKMQQAQNQGQEGRMDPAKQARDQAAQALDKAAQQAAQASQQMQASQSAQQNTPENQQAGQAMQQAQNQMNQAQSELGQGKSQQANGSMQQAAKNLEQAAQQLAKQQQNQQRGEGQPEGGAEPAKAAANSGPQVDQGLLPADMKKYAGKRWGELPGELRTQIIQDMKAKYGDSHARMIKLYFEQVGEQKK